MSSSQKLTTDHVLEVVIMVGNLTEDLEIAIINKSMKQPMAGHLSMIMRLRDSESNDSTQ